jgi:deoxyribose-phosphate aldolase
MDKLTEEQISQVVDEVVRRVQQRLSQPATAVQPAADSCGFPTPETEQAESGKKMLENGAARISCTGTGNISCGEISPYIDHTLLKPDATEADITQLCREALEHRFASVCVNTSYVELCSRLLSGSGVRVCAVVGFPLGAMSSDAKAFETRDAIAHGADEIDMVINVGQLQSGNYNYVIEDIRAVVRAAAGHTVKVIIETALLTDDQKVAACVLAKAAGADFVKTSTGFGPGGARPEDVALMRRVVGDQMGVKASGGIRDCSTAQKMIASGATRIGASASIGIVKGKPGKTPC